MLMRTVKKLLAIVAALAVASLLLSINEPLGVGPNFIYSFIILLAFGWFLYLPFVALHGVLVRRFTGPAPAASPLIGSVLAVLMVAILTWAPVTFISVLPVFSGSRGFDLISFGVGGGFYGLLHWKWIATPTRSTGTQS